MKLKISEWGNSHGVRIPNTIMEHLKIQAGEEVEVNLTSNGIEIVKYGHPQDHLKSIKHEILESVLARTAPVQQVEDPYSETDVAYIVIDINPCAPLIREVPRGTENAFTTLADAKEAARQVIQTSIAEAQQSLVALRQLGIDTITYISL